MVMFGVIFLNYTKMIRTNALSHWKYGFLICIEAKGGKEGKWEGVCEGWEGWEVAIFCHQIVVIWWQNIY